MVTCLLSISTDYRRSTFAISLHINDIMQITIACVTSCHCHQQQYKSFADSNNLDQRNEIHDRQARVEDNMAYQVHCCPSTILGTIISESCLRQQFIPPALHFRNSTPSLGTEPVPSKFSDNRKNCPSRNCTVYTIKCASRLAAAARWALA